MNRFFAVTGLMTFGLIAHAAQGKHIAKAVLVARTGATVSSVDADMNGCCRFTNVPPGEYKIMFTNAEGRCVTVSDLDGDGQNDIVIEGRPSFTATGTFADGSAAAPAPVGQGTGKVSVSSFNVMKTAAPAAPVASPRDSSTGMATGRRMHKPYCAILDWDGSIKGGFMSEASAKSEGERLPENASGRCALRVVVDEQPGTIEVQSWSLGASNPSGKYVGTVTLVK